MDAADTNNPIHEVIRRKLVNSLWRFGPSIGVPKTDRMGFSEAGAIENYQHPNEKSWRITNGQLFIFDAEGKLMWFATRYFEDEQRGVILLKTQRDADAEFTLREISPRPAAPIEAVQGNPLSTADFLFPKDLRVTPTSFSRVLLIGSCMTALYEEAFKRIAPATVFDYVVFNYAGALPALAAPVGEYDLQYVQIPLRSVLTDRVVWAMRFNEAGFAKEILATGYHVIDAMLESALVHNKSHGVLTFVSNFIVPQMAVAADLMGCYTDADLASLVRSLNDYLARRLLSYQNVYLADVNGVAESIGKQYVLDDMINFYAHNGAFFREWVGYERPARIEAIPPMDEFYTSKRLEFAQAVYDQIVALYRTCRQIDQVKAVIFDLDNTMWRGQLAEDYRAGESGWPHTDGWPLGIWETVHHLRARGILVSICSKNDFEMVERLWDEVVQPGFIKLSDFVSPQINWRPKAENILQICQELNIKPKSVVFVDDNPVERAAVKAEIPEIRVMGANPYLTRRILLWAPETQTARLTGESSRREEMVRSQIERDQERNTLSREAFLQSLNCAMEFISITQSQQAEFARVVELVNKTNQFNTTGKRWPAADILEFISNGGDITAFRVKDRFTDYGLVGVLFSRLDRIEQFVMSCRVLGMDLELAAINYVVTLLRAKRGGGMVHAHLVETQDNSPCRDVFLRAGFTMAPADDLSTQFVLDAAALPVSPAHVH